MAASNSTALVSWRLEDGGRSTWALVWSCLVTIFACTWTVLHLNLPRRNSPTVRIVLANISYWLLAIFFPEYVFVHASYGLYRAMLLKQVCNQAQKTRYLDLVDRESWLSKRASPLEQKQNQESAEPHLFRTEWTLRKCFCILAGGLALQTQDGWIYVLRRSDMQLFIQAGIIEDVDFHDRDVEDRAKSDSLGKIFTVIQTAWFLVNMIARWANSLPVAPIELATVAYIACGLLMYATWWYKPKGMAAPITIYVRSDREDMPAHLLNHIATNPHGWVHIRAQIKKATVVSVFAQTIRFFFEATRITEDVVNDDVPYTSLYKPSHGCIVTAINTFVAFLYCGIHLAGWNFPFPTEAERIAWLVSSLACIVMVGIYSLASTIPTYVVWFESRNLFSFYTKAFNARKLLMYRMLMLAMLTCFAVYVVLRLIIMALAFTSLRALPVGCYTTVEWVMSIPHV